MKYVTYESHNRIGYITLNRPEKRNALNPELVADLKYAFELAEEDENAKVIILKANGKAFCAGADLAVMQKMQTNTLEENIDDSESLMLLYKKIYTLKKIVIAQVEGHAIAGGAGLATVCDFAYATNEVKFGYTEVAIGFVPAIVSVFLIKKIGEAKAKELLLTGTIITAKHAVEYGIFNAVYFEGNIEYEVNQFARKLIKSASTDSLRLTKQLIADVQSLSYSEALLHASKINAISRETDDCKKGIASFLNKEKITW